jgi:hypothetical protein
MPLNKKDFDKRIDRLDRLLLHVTSLLGIIFGLSQVIFGDIESIIFFIPFVLLIWFIPVYYGYIYGAIVYDNIFLRYKGWIYFFGGFFVYVIFSCIYFFRTRYNTFLLWSDYMFIIIAILILLFLMFRVQKKYFNFFNYKISDVERLILKRIYVNLLLIGLVALFYFIALYTFVESIEDFFSAPMYITLGFFSLLVVMIIATELSNIKLFDSKKLPDIIHIWKIIVLAVLFFTLLSLTIVLPLLIPDVIVLYINLFLILIYLLTSISYFLIFCLTEYVYISHIKNI